MPRQRRNPRKLIQPPDGTPVTLSEEEALPLLECAEIIGGYRMPWGSNYTFQVWLDAGTDKYLKAIYKPRDGERPLYDFPPGSLFKREYATFLFSRNLGWPNVPITLIRDGPYGIGSVQLYIECDPEITYFDLIEDEAESLQQFAIFDLLANNADRKAGHCLLGEDGRVWSIDHGLTFHPVFKLRTVMLEFWGKPIPEHLVADIEGLLHRLESKDSIASELGEMLTGQEIKAIKQRLQIVLDDPVLPQLDPYHNVPWPWM